MDEYVLFLQRQNEQLKEEVKLWKDIAWLASTQEAKKTLSPLFPDRQVPDAVPDGSLVQRSGLG